MGRVLRGDIDQRLLAALTFVHAHATSGVGVQNLVSQSGHGIAALAPDVAGFFWVVQLRLTLPALRKGGSASLCHR
jgi:hypothetical protein